MNDVIMYAYRNTSDGAILVSKAMGILKMNHEDSDWVPRFGRTIVNWGSGQFPRANMFRARVLNHPDALCTTINKRDFFTKVYADTTGWKAPRCPDVCFDEKTAKGWLKDGKAVVARTVLKGSQGQGVKVMHKPVDFVYAPLYTMFIDKDYEYRVHVIGGKVVEWQERLRDVERDGDEPDDQWRIYNRHQPADDVLHQSVKAVKFFGLDFGAVDILQKDGRGYVLEINSAPWMSERLAEVYAKALKELIAA